MKPTNLTQRHKRIAAAAREAFKQHCDYTRTWCERRLSGRVYLKFAVWERPGAALGLNAAMAVIENHGGKNVRVEFPKYRYSVALSFE